MLDKLISIAEKNLINELETYVKLPFFLGILYLALRPNNTLYINNAGVRLGAPEKPGGTYELYVTFGSGWDTWSPQDLSQFRTYDLITGDPHTIHPVLTMCYFNPPPKKRFTKGLILPKEYTKQYIYYRNKSIKNTLEVLVNNYMRRYNTIPFIYALPYLYFNRDKSLNLKANYYYHNHIIKYNLQNNTTSARPLNSIRSYSSIMTPSELVNIYNESLHTSGFSLVAPIKVLVNTI